MCSNKQVPEYSKRADELLAEGVDSVLCTAVNGEERSQLGEAWLASAERCCPWLGLALTTATYGTCSTRLNSRVFSAA